MNERTLLIKLDHFLCVSGVKTAVVSDARKDTYGREVFRHDVSTKCLGKNYSVYEQMVVLANRIYQSSTVL
jgi:hypothetical protein